MVDDCCVLQDVIDKVKLWSDEWQLSMSVRKCAAICVSHFITSRQYAGGLSYGKGVRLSVRLSVTRVNCDKTNESSAEILIPYER